MAEERDDSAWRQLAAMAEMQERHNRLVHREWASQGHEYYRAVWVECAELLDHFGWKWWKKPQADIEQAKLEIVDIWHFGLSELIRADQVNRKLAARLKSALSSQELSNQERQDFRLAVERLALASLATRQFDLDAFAAVMRSLPLSFDELYRLYIGKNALNAFRQEHGYKAGSYRKRWQGREDNEHLMDILRELDSGQADFAERVSAALAERYAGANSS